MRAAQRIAAIGDVVAGPALAHKATAEAAVAAEALSGRPAAFDARAIPIVIFTDPEIGSVGMSEGQAREAGLEPVVATFPLAASGRAATLGAREGFTRIVADAATDRVVGVHVVGPHASELVAGGALAIELMAAPGDVAATIHPHPTLSEGLREAAALMLGHPLHVAGARPTLPTAPSHACARDGPKRHHRGKRTSAAAGRRTPNVGLPLQGAGPTFGASGRPRAAARRCLRPRSPSCAAGPSGPWRRAFPRTTPGARG